MSWKCQKGGHFAKVCRGRAVTKSKVSAAATVPVGTATSLSKSSGTVDIEGMQVKAFFGSGSRESFIHPSFTLGAQISLVVNLLSGTESMATSASSSVKVRGTCVANMSYQGHKYQGFKLSVLPGLCADSSWGLISYRSTQASSSITVAPTHPCLSVGLVHWM